MYTSKCNTVRVRELMVSRSQEPKFFTRRDIEQAMLEAVLTRKLDALESVIVGGTKYMKQMKQGQLSFETALHLAAQLEFVEAIGLLLLCQAVKDDNPKAVTMLLSDPLNTNTCLWYVPLVREARISGRLQTIRPIYLSVMLERPAVTKELLLFTDLDMKKRYVDWSGLRLNDMHPTWIQAIAPWVLTMRVTRNRLSQCPKEILQAKQLRRLDLSENHLHSVPPGLFALPNLENLDLKKNFLQELPEVKEWSQSLLVLDLSGNKLDLLPNSLQDSNIQMLLLSKNSLSQLPRVLCHIHNMTTLDISYMGFSKSDLPPELCKRGLTVICKAGQEAPEGNFARLGRTLARQRTRVRQTKPNSHMNLVIIGGSDVGRRLVTTKLHSKSAQVTDSGPLEIIEWSYRKAIWSTKVNFNTLVLPNDADLHHLYPCFFRPSALYIIIVDLTEIFSLPEQIQAPIAMLKRYYAMANIQFVLILPPKYPQPFNAHECADYNKLEVLKSKSKTEMQSFYFHETVVMSEDPTLGGGVVTDPRPKIYEAALNSRLCEMCIIGMEWPESFYELVAPLQKRAQFLQQQGRPMVITEEELWHIVQESCRDERPPRAELPDIIDFLEMVGAVFLYADPIQRLKDFFFLCPCWIFETLSTVLGKVKEGKQVVRLVGDVRRIAVENSIPRYLVDPLLHLLARYAIALPTGSAQILFPYLLSSTNLPKPDRKEGALRRQFSPITQSLPCDIWPRLISLVVSRHYEIVTPVSGEGASAELEPHEGLLSTCPLPTGPDADCRLESSAAGPPDNGFDMFDGNGMALKTVAGGKIRRRDITLTERLGRKPASFYHPKRQGAEDISLSGLPGNVKLWDRAIQFSAEPYHYFIHPCKSNYSEAGIEVATPNTKEGHLVMARLSFLLQNLLQDCYPDLYLLDRQQKNSMMENVLCPSCILNSVQFPTSFAVTASLPSVRRSSNASCSQGESHFTEYSHLLPDVHLLDIPSSYHIKMEDLAMVHQMPLHVSSDHVVYPAQFKKKSVLVKEYLWRQQVSPILPYFQMRQEATLLLNLQHSNVVKLLAVLPCFISKDGDCRPAIVLERALMGTLRDNLLDQETTIRRIVCFHMACQVAEALSFLHFSNIVYRALRASSVLVWSVDLKDDFSVKLTNFNRARKSFPSGLFTKPGLLCVQAPEMYHMEESQQYTEKVDIYAYGFLLYELMTEKAVTSQFLSSQPPKLKENLFPLYGNLVDTMHSCWNVDPDKRMSAFDIQEKMRNVVYQLLQYTQYLHDTSLVRHCCMVESARQIWCCCDDDLKTQIFIISAEEDLSILGSLEMDDRSHCIAAMDSQVLIGLNNASVRVYDTQKYQFTGSHKVEDSVSTLAVGDTYAFVGQANGTITCHPKLAFPHNCVTISVGHDPVYSMVVIQDVLLVACGREVVQLNADEDVQVQQRWEGCTLEEVGIKALVVGQENKVAWTITRQGLALRTWELERSTCVHTLDLKDLLEPICSAKQIPKAERVLSLLVYEDTLWLSFNNGMIIIMDTTRVPVSLITWFRPYRREAKCQLIVPSLGAAQLLKATIVTSGYVTLGATAHAKSQDKPAVSYWEALTASELRLLVRRELQTV